MNSNLGVHLSQDRRKIYAYLCHAICITAH
uniref:Uncharacterized protein n=1 Tax=Triticum urartu TaxID=4572 RepID=A0A8R7P551_TRIUA